MAATLVRTAVTLYLYNYKASVEMDPGLPVLFLAFQLISHDVASHLWDQLYFTVIMSI